MPRPPQRRNRSALSRARRDRRGRGLRGELAPHGVPLARTRAQRFDELVLDAVEHLEDRWSRELERVEFAVEDVPAIEHAAPDDIVYGPDVIEDGNVPLARLIRAERGRDGRPTPPRIVLYRRPLEIRALDRLDLADLVHDVVVEQVASLLGLDPEEVDPP
ncbi:MAG: metallopeptidase family protein [Actinobacteria bacterium]|nr:metallopeptidase family protein [Actinomycetota bacterium]MBI3687844.1 metallopeptidase family protein [Actinomycetota bacterium]